MENPNTKNIALAVLVVLVLGFLGYRFYGADATPSPETNVETVATTAEVVGTETPVDKPETTVKPAPAPVAQVPVLQYPTGCTSGTGTSATTGTACDGSAKLTITTPINLPAAQSGKPYKVALSTSGGPAEKVSYTWSVERKAGAFPIPGLDFSAIYGNSVSIVGTPADMYFNGVRATVPVTFTLKVAVTAGEQLATKEFKLVVEPVTTGS